MNTIVPTRIVPTICRLCIAHCGVLAEIADDNGRRKVTKVTGDPDNPVFRGYTCPKGRALPLPLLCTLSFGAALERIEGESKDAFLERARNALLALAPEEA